MQATQISTGDYLYPVWLYHRFNMSHRNIEDLLAERGIAVSTGASLLVRFLVYIGPDFREEVTSHTQTFY